MQIARTVSTRDQSALTNKQWRFWDFLFGGQWGPWFWIGGIQSEQLQVSYYELIYARFWF